MDIAVWNSIFLAVIYFLYFAVILTTIFVVILDNRSPVKTMAWMPDSGTQRHPQG